MIFEGFEKCSIFKLAWYGKHDPDIEEKIVCGEERSNILGKLEIALHEIEQDHGLDTEEGATEMWERAYNIFEDTAGIKMESDILVDTRKLDGLFDLTTLVNLGANNIEIGNEEIFEDGKRWHD